MGGQQKKKVKLSASSRYTRSRRESTLTGASRSASSRRNVSTSETAALVSSELSESSVPGTETGTGAVSIPTGTFVTGQFLSSLECQICAEVMTPPVRLCVAGHSTCGKCSSKMLRCGFCREPFSSGRNHSIENILSSCAVPCQFKSAGCSETIKLLDYASHTNSCPSNPNPVSPQNNPSTTGEGERTRLGTSIDSIMPQVRIFIQRLELRNRVVETVRFWNSSHSAHPQTDDDVRVLENFQFVPPVAVREVPLVVDLVSSDSDEED